MSLHSSIARLLIPATAILLGSCMLGPDFQSPDADAGSGWKETSATPGSRLPDQWWRLFNDAELNRLVNLALQNNQNLAAAKSRVDTSRALIGLDRARLFPTLDLNGSAGYSRNSEQAVSENLPPNAVADLSNQRYRASFDLAYDPDLWGRNKRSLEASTAEAAQAEALLDAERLGLAAEVARQYFILCGLDEQHRILVETIRSRGETEEVQSIRAETGLADALSATKALAELELAKNDLAQVQRQRASAENALATLCGSRPSGFSISQRKQPDSMPSIRPGLPAEVLSRRPDVRAAEQNLRAANARIGVAEAAFYPNFALNASSGFESLEAQDFLNWENRILGLGAGIAAPVFTGGGNQANLDAALARRDESLAVYKNTLLISLREVEDAATDLKGLARSHSTLTAALKAAQDTLQLATKRFNSGLVTFLEVTDAERTVLGIRLQLAQTRAQQHITLAAMAKALGGGWSGK